MIFRYTGGVPRLINTLCDTSMMAAFAHESDVVTLTDVETAIDEMQWVEYADRSNRVNGVIASNSTPPARIQPDNSFDEATGERRIILGRVLIGFNGQTIAEHDLQTGRFIIGRTPDNDLQIDSKYISRHHAQIITTVQTSVLEDLNSTNGVYVRAKRVRRRALNDGDVIHIGQHEIMYFDERLSRTRVTIGGEPDDEVVPLLGNGHRGRALEGEDEEDDADSLPAHTS